MDYVCHYLFDRSTGKPLILKKVDIPYSPFEFEIHKEAAHFKQGERKKPKMHD